MTEPSWRKPAGMLLILLGIAVWAGLVLSVSDYILTLTWPLQAVFFTVAGLIWIAPLKPLLRWMETGAWRE